jgi:hypothetical protein
MFTICQKQSTEMTCLTNLNLPLRFCDLGYQKENSGVGELPHKTLPLPMVSSQKFACCLVREFNFFIGRYIVMTYNKLLGFF